MTITVHTMVKNESRFVWYSVMSVIDYVDKVLIWDTGSTDETLDILREIKKVDKKKVELNVLGEVDIYEFARVRQGMLESTSEGWILMVDGDEIWWDKSIRLVTDFVNKHGDEYESLVVPTKNFVGDIFHYQEDRAGNYNLAGKRGHLALRGISTRIPGLISDRPHGTWGWADENKRQIQDRDKQKIKYLQAPYLHATYLRRSDTSMGDRRVPKRAMKRKREIGIEFDHDFYYPEVFFRPRPKIVPSVWEKMSGQFYARSAIETPLKKVRRRLLKPKVGY